MSALSGLGSPLTTAASSTSGSNSLAQVSQNEFLQLLLTQLQNQNPLDPMSSTDFATQLATLSEVGSLDSLNTNFGSLLQVQQLSSASNLIGRSVTYTVPGSNAQGQGVVDGLTVQNGAADLSVNGTNIPISQVNSIN